MPGYRAVPEVIRHQILGSSSDTFYIGRTRKYDRADLMSGELAHLGITWGADGLSMPSEPVIPAADRGRWSTYNVRGREIVRRDLPKSQKTTGVWTTPHFGDWSKGSHTHFHVRDVYQRETLYGRGLPLVVTEHNHTDDTVQIGFVVDRVFDRTALDEADLLLACSLIRENIGSHASVRPTDLPVAEWMSKQSVSWEILPVGELGPDPFGKDGEATRRLKLDPDSPRVQLMADRFNKVHAIGTPEIVLGQGEFTRYVGFQFRDDLVALECLTYGNALYLMYEDWKSLSQRSRLDLLADTTARYTRVIHTEGWEGRLAGHLQGHGYPPQD
jgi:hypothetical protein